MNYKPSKEVIQLIKNAHELLETDVIESISKLIQAMEKMYIEQKRQKIEEKSKCK